MTDERARERFWSKVNKNGGVPAHVPDLGPCWNWDASRARYGHFFFRGKVATAHRASWILHHGDIPDGLFVLHACDNAVCVRPSHLFLGTQSDNALDRERKGRGRNSRGTSNGRDKVTDAQALEIIRRKALGECKTKLAREFGIGRTQVRRIGKSQWLHLLPATAIAHEVSHAI